MGQIYDEYNPRHRQEQRRERRKQVTGIQVVFIAILAIGLLLTINFSARIRRGQLYTTLRDQAQATIDALQAENKRLYEEKEFAQSDDSIEQWAHREGKMVRPGEVLVIPIPGLPSLDAATPTPTPVPQDDEPSEPAPSTWELWWSLFFDGDPPW